MRASTKLGVLVATCLAAAVASAPAGAVAFTTQVVNISGTNKAILYSPAANPHAHVGLFVMHSFSGYSTFGACSQLATAGYTMLCADTVFTNRHFEYKGYEDHAPAITAGIKFLRSQTGITKVLLFGHSMGAPMMTFYDWVQENGATVCQDPRRILGCDTTNLLDSNGNNALQPVDGIILFDAHLGDALATFTYMDPAIKDPDKPGHRDTHLDMFAAQNGYPGDAAAGAPTFKSAPYSPSFQKRFFDAQADRNADVLKDATKLYQKVVDGDPSVYPDDMPFAVPGSEGAARMWQADLDLMKCTKRPHILLSHDGTTNVSPGPVCSVRPPSASAAGDDSFGSDIHASVRVWLGAHALRSTGNYGQFRDDITGIDYDSTNTSAFVHVQGISKPILVVSNSGHYFLRPDEIIFDAMRSADKTYAIEEGSVHGGTECTACEQMLGLPHGFYGDTFTRTMNFMTLWLNARF